MNIKQTSFIALLVSCVSVATAVAAAVPSSVQNVSAAYSGDKLTVTWQAVTDTDIDHYNVYYSRASILGNQGNYDDFERTKAADTNFTFEVAPYKGNKVFVSVMAVNKAGIESDSFEAEASAQMPTATQSSSIASSVQTSMSSSRSGLSPFDVFAPSSVPTISSVSSSVEPLALMRVRGYSQTGVLLEFSKALNANQALFPNQFVIVDSSGSQLTIKSVALSGSSMLLLDTAAQVGEKVYVLGLLQTVTGADNSKLAEPLPQVTFFGYKNLTGTQSSIPYIPNPGTQQSSNPALPADLIAPEDPRNLGLTPKIRSDGTYDVGAFWVGSINSARDLADYNIYTTTDGINFVPGDPVGRTNVMFSNVEPGVFGVKVTARDSAGNESTGVSKIIDLPNSGVGLLSLIAISGAFAGNRTMKRRKQG
ncbi:MAG: fibronectin type III domain-containing protein [Candidatus Peribacteraceae bacterium]|nr:fibronectin type III domain-containing protein [Candidatus Peribacteraceae bacterium]